MNMLILTGSFGMGHNSASIALEQDINKNLPDTNIEIIDIVEYIFPKLHKTIYKSFNIIAGKYHDFYNFSYKIADKNLNMPFEKTIIHKVHKLIQAQKPDIIISTLPLSSKAISVYKEAFNSDIPLITCITDISTCSEWVNDHTNIYFVATNSIKESLINKGVSEDNFIVSGIPVKDQFKNISNSIKELSPTRNKKLLIMGGGLGLFPVTDDFYSSLDKLPNVKTTIITGNNKDAYNSLYGKYNNIEVIGYSKTVHKHMQNADLIISKAGGITLFETIYSNLPIFVIHPFLAQEVHNALFIEEKGIGKVIWNKDEDTITEITDLLHNDIELYNMKNKMRLIKNNLIENPIIDAIKHLHMEEVS